MEGAGESERWLLPAHHLVTHGVIVGMTGSGKTGLVTVAIEEALRAKVPVLMLDVKGDLPNLLLSFPTFDPAAFLPWAAGTAEPGDERPVEAMAAELAGKRRRMLEGWGIGEKELLSFHSSTDIRVITPGSTGGESLHVLSSLERRSPRWDHDPESARASLSAALSLVLRLVGRDPDPARSREHVLLSVLAEARLRRGETADLGACYREALLMGPRPPCAMPISPGVGGRTIAMAIAPYAHRTQVMPITLRDRRASNDDAHLRRALRARRDGHRGLCAPRSVQKRSSSSWRDASSTNRWSTRISW